MDGAFALVMKPLLYLKMDSCGYWKRKKKLVYYVLCYFFKVIFNAVADYFDWIYVIL
jgi:retron-type reverse transcriptase